MIIISISQNKFKNDPLYYENEPNITNKTKTLLKLLNY